MKHLNIKEIHDSFIDISEYNIGYEADKLVLGDKELLVRINELVNDGNGYAICHGVQPLAEKFNLSFENEDQLEMIKNFLEGVYHQALANLDMEKVNVVGTVYSDPGIMDFDGYNANKKFRPNEHAPLREFTTTKCIHFDSASPFTANIFGPNKNISGGYTIISETNRYCKDNNVDPQTIVQNMPASYNCVVRAEHYQEILNNYSFAIKHDLENDLLFVLTLNEVTGGVAHGATTPSKIDESQPAYRPIRHMEMQFDDPSNYEVWFKYYDLTLESPEVMAKSKGKNLILDYYQPSNEPFNHIVEVNSI